MKILIVAPLPPPFTGQAAVSEIALKCLTKNKLFVVNTNLTKHKLLATVVIITKITLAIFIKGPDLVYFTCTRSFLGSFKDIVLLNLCYIKNIQAINHLHGSDLNTFVKRYPKSFKPLLLNAYKKIEKHILLDKEMDQELIQIQSKKFNILPNPYSKEYCMEDYDSFSAIKKPKRLLYLSNLIKSKGILELLDAFQLIMEHGKTEYTLDIGGDFMSDDFLSKQEIKDAFYKKYNSIIDRYPNNIHYHGVMKGQKKIDFLKSSGIFILPSYYKIEAYPISIIEAMYFGNVIITSNINYLGKIFKDDNGVILNVVTPETIYHAINQISNSSKFKTISKFNHHQAKSNNSPDIFCEKLNTIINQTIGE